MMSPHTLLKATLNYAFVFLCLLVMTAPSQALAQSRSDIVEQPHLNAKLMSEQAQVAAGSSFWVAVKLMPEAGWHTYWMNPGDSGLATQIQWQLPDGATVGPILWPIAEKYRIGPLANYGFEGDTYLLQKITLTDDFSAQQLSLANRVDWLVCEEYCIPGHAEFELTLPIASDSEPAADNQASFTQARNNLPNTADWPIYFDIQGNTVTFILEHPQAIEMAQSDDFYIFVGAGELVEHAEEAEVEVADNSVIVRRTRNAYYYGVEDAFPVLLVGGHQAVELTAQSVNEGNFSPSPEDNATASSLGLASVLAFAFIGGLILNLMPCVFPVLSLKALAIANHHDGRLADSLWYTLGVVITFIFIAGLLLILRASGAALGWGFQLQSPWLIALLALLFTAIALNLSGVFQMATSIAQLANVAPKHSGSSRARGSFSTGILAVIIASPCTAPFMGVALGFAIVQPAPIALLVFAVLGLGLAFPFLLLAMVPALAKLLPKPGPWMESFKQWMAIPIYLTTIWLLWVFARQAGVDSQAILLVGLTLLATTLWVFGKRQLQGRKSRTTLFAMVALLLLTLASVYAALSMAQPPAQSTTDTQHWQSWSEQQLTEAREEGPVFVNMTADWCITCLANERVALNTSATRALFSEHGITYLKGDWTLQDPAITEYLAQYGRNGVPLYVMYWPDREPEVLPQILTNTIVREHVEALSAPL